MAKQKLIDTLFNIYAQNLALVKQSPLVSFEPDLPDVVMCPVCFDTFYSRGAIEEKIITVEHVPPKSLGGKPMTITCRRCNTELYSQLDEQLRSRISLKPFFDGKPGAVAERVKAKIKNGPGFWGKIEIQTDGSQLLKIDQELDAKHFELIVQALSQPEILINTEIRFPKKERENIELLRIAYLLLFEAFGYGLIAHPNYEPIRNQLRNPTSEVLHNYGLIESKGAEFPDEMVGINMIEEPRELRSFLIVFDLSVKGHPSERHAVLIPGPGLPTFDDMSRLLIESPDFSPPRMKVQHINENSRDEMKLTEPFVAHQLWHNLNVDSQ